MCGRFTNKLTWEDIVRLYRLTLDAPPHNLRPRYNVCPTDTIDTIVFEQGVRGLVPMRWGLVPNWWSKPVCTENVVRIDLEGESLNVDHDGRADDSLLELDWLGAQVQERT
jgi:putative SOS response-associated peptidase YedK